MAKHVTNMAASVHDRLLAIAQKEGRSLTELVLYFAMDRFLFRLSKSKHTATFVLKGGLMLGSDHTHKPYPPEEAFARLISNFCKFIARHSDG